MIQRVQRGFTLIELLLVIAIVGIVAAVAVPSFKDYLAKAQAEEAFQLLGGLEAVIVADVAQDPSNYTCEVPAGSATKGKYVATLVAQWTPPNCDLIATFSDVGVATPLRGKTVILRFDSTTGFFVLSQAATGFTLPLKYVPPAWRK